MINFKNLSEEELDKLSYNEKVELIVHMLRQIPMEMRQEVFEEINKMIEERLKEKP